MKRLIFTFFIIAALSGFLSGCGAPAGDGGAVALDGPIRETMAKTGEFEFNGAVINISDQPVSSIYVVIILKDEAGEIIEANSVSVLGESEDLVLMPGESAFFTVTFQSDPSSALNKDVEIYYDEAGFDE